MRAQSLLLLVVGLSLGPTACDAPSPAGETAPSGAARAVWDEMVETEERIHALRPAMAALARAVANLRVPDEGARDVFDVSVAATDLGPTPPNGDAASPFGFRPWPLAASAPPAGGRDLDLWRPLLDQVDHFRDARFKVIDGHFEKHGGEKPGDSFESRVHFSGLAVTHDGTLLALRGELDLRWARRAASEPEGDATWRIARWHTRSLEVQRAERPLFRDVIDAALPDPSQRRRARESRHEALVIEKLTRPERFTPPHEYFFQGAQDRHPGIAVVDIDMDGDDDLYVMERWGPNQLLVNRGDGRFDERATEFGLDLVDHSAAAIFADFDNDGDPDVFVGRTLEPSRYLENEGGHFIDRSAQMLDGGVLPGLVSSVTAADVDRDGLLDLYVSTYAAQMLVYELQKFERRRRELGELPPPALLGDFLPADDARRLEQLARSSDAHEFLALPGPPNVLLRNVGGGRFALADAGPLRVFRNTYQATWSDYDDDGDPDVYLAHDFAPNQLIRNDGDAGFTDVTEETGTADIGFGMGVSWGDYDRDGRQDLYVSNMYSSAGKRVLAHFPDGDPRLRKMAGGNTLFRNQGERFQPVSGTEDGALQVEAAGWAWGGQFADFDNDGFLDLYVPAGYYTAPTHAEAAVDI